MTLLAFASGCGKSNDSNPAQPSGSSGGSQSVSVVAPKPQQPANGSSIRNVDQPVTLVIGNGVVTGNASATYTFEVATDSNFSNKVQTKDAVAQGSGSQTSVRLDQLAAGTDYYWHARTVGGGTTGVFSPTYRFSVGPAIILQAPTPISPASGTTSAGWPTFTVANAARSGPAGALTYRFEVAANSTFTPVLLFGTVAETPTATSFTPPAGTAPPPTRALFWRATAVDQANGVSSASSSISSFTYGDASRAAALAQQAGFTLWPGAQPTGTPGRIQWGGGWDVQTVASHGGVIHVVPTLEELRVADLLDRGLDPDAALGWMNSNGYPTSAVHYPNIGTPQGVIGFAFEYMAYVDGAWGLVLRVE